MRARVLAAPRATATAQRRLACLAGFSRTATVMDKILRFAHTSYSTYVRGAARSRVLNQFLGCVFAKPRNELPATLRPGLRACVLELGRWRGKGFDISGNGSSGHVLRAASEHLLYCLPRRTTQVLCVLSAYHRVLSHKPLHPCPLLATAVLFGATGMDTTTVLGGRNPAKLLTRGSSVWETALSRYNK